jgi:predicted ATP-grasp superfamily ATP-dependent carboligase
MAESFRSRDGLVAAVEEAAFDRPPALVCNAHVTGLGVARALAAADVPVVAIDRVGTGAAPTSSAVRLAGRVTYPLDDREGFRRDLERIAAACESDPVVFACMDEWVHAVAGTEPDGVVRPFSDRTVIDAVLDKESLYGSAERLGVPYPETYRVEQATTGDTRENALPTLSAAEAADRLGFPLVVKPALKRRFEAAVGTNVVEVGDREAYRDVVSRAREAGIRVMAQRHVETATGRDRSLASYVPESGVEDVVGTVGEATVRHPPAYGTSCVVEETADATVRERALSVLDDAGYHGISESEFVYDPDRETYLLIDVNTRPWKWVGMPVAAGYNLPLAAYADATGGEYDPASGDGGTTWVHLPDYLATLADDPTPAASGALSGAEWRALLDGSFESGGAVTTGVYRPSDPDPAYRLIRTELADGDYYCAC